LSDIPGALYDADAFVERALKLNPNLASTWLFSGWVKAAKGDAEKALEHLARARQLSPNDPQDFSLKTATGFAYFVAGHYSEGLAHGEAAERTKPNYLLAKLVSAVCAALAGRDEVARNAVGRVLQISPKLRISLVEPVLIMRPEDFARWKDGLQKAGLPE
jgi:tetratricopeptide (TPR) repeat protein